MSLDRNAGRWAATFLGAWAAALLLAGAEVYIQPGLRTARRKFEAFREEYQALRSRQRELLRLRGAGDATELLAEPPKSLRLRLLAARAAAAETEAAALEGVLTLGELEHWVRREPLLSAEKPNIEAELEPWEGPNSVLAPALILTLAVAVLLLAAFLLAARPPRPAVPGGGAAGRRGRFDLLARAVWSGQWSALPLAAGTLCLLALPESQEADYPTLAALMAGGALCGLGAAPFVPARGRLAFSEGWRWRDTRFGKELRAIAWAAAAVALLLPGSFLVEPSPDGGVKIPRGRLARWCGIFATLPALALSLLGFAGGNLLRLQTLFPLDWALYGFLALCAAAVGIAAWREKGRRRGLRYADCPGCRRKDCFPNVEFELLDVYFRRHVCPHCRARVTVQGEPVPEFPPLGPRALLTPLFATATAFLGSALVGVLGTGAVWDALGRRALDAAQQRVRAEGFRTAPPEPAPRAGSAEANAAFWLRKAKETGSIYLYEAVNAAEKFSPEGFLRKAAAGEVPGDLSAAKRVLARHREALTLWRRAAAAERADWEIDWTTRGYLWYPPGLDQSSGWLHLAELAATAATVDALEGRTREAAAGIRDALRLGEALSGAGLLIPEAAGQKIARQALAAARLVLPRLPPSETSAWAPYLDPDALARRSLAALELELFARTRWIETISWREAAGLPPPEGVMYRLYWPFLKLDLASHFDGQLEFLRTLRLPHREFRPAWEAAERRFARSAWSMASVVRPDYSSFHLRSLETAAHMRLARGAIWARSRRAQTGRWPDSVAETDPFTGTPLRLLRKEGKLLLFSLGPDGADNHGESIRGTDGKGDLVWPLE